MDVYSIIERYYRRGTRIHQILVEHSHSVATLALSIAEKHPELSLDRQLLFEGAMLHDIGIWQTHAPGIACFGREPYLRHGYLGGILLRKEGLEQHALICERHTGSGITADEIAVARLPLPNDRSYLPLSLEEKLICYADSFFSKTRLGEMKNYNSVREKTWRLWVHRAPHLAKASVERLDALHDLFG